MDGFYRENGNSTFSFLPTSPPPETFRHIRSGVFKSLLESWDEYMRTPQFQEIMKQSMDNAIAVRKMINESLNQVHHDFQGVAKEDIDNLVVTIRLQGKQTLDRLDKMESRLDEISNRLDSLEKKGNSESSTTVRKEPTRRLGKKATNKRPNK